MKIAGAIVAQDPRGWLAAAFFVATALTVLLTVPLQRSRSTLRRRASPSSPGWRPRGQRERKGSHASRESPSSWLAALLAWAALQAFPGRNLPIQPGNPWATTSVRSPGRSLSLRA